MDIKEIKQLLKTLKFPCAGARVSLAGAAWSKRHGHAGASVIERVRDSARTVGFTMVDSAMGSDATGDRVRRGTTYVRGNVSITFESFYGQTAYENRFSICVSVKA